MMFNIVRTFRSWHQLSSVHLIHKKVPPPITHTFTERGLLIHPTQKGFNPPPMINISFAAPESAPIVPPAPMFRIPLLAKDKVSTNKTVQAVQRNLATSYKKIGPLLRGITKMHIYDAQLKVETLNKKVGPMMAKILSAALANAVNTKGMAEERLYVKTAVTGKNRSIPHMRYHAKGRTGRGERARVQVTLTLEEKSPEDMFKIIMRGKFSPAMAGAMRLNLLANESPLPDVVKYQNMLTSRGRIQQYRMVKRRVEQAEYENKKKGIVISKEDLEEMILDEEAKEFAEKYWAKKRAEVESRISMRQEQFLKNEGI